MSGKRKNQKLTARQHQVLSFIWRTINQRGYPPTYREIAQHLGIRWTGGVEVAIHALCRKGYLKRQSKTSRGIGLTESARRLFSKVTEIPILGQIAAGQPLLAEENFEGVLRIEEFLPSDSRLFALKVKGDSMKGAGILDGDYVIARQQPTAEKGDIVVAIIGEEATVKKFVPKGKKVRLEPANEAYEPIVLDKKSPDLYIAGKVVGLFRRF